MQPDTRRSEFLETILREALPGLSLSSRLTDRVAYARDQWPRSLLQVRQGQVGKLPDLITWPQSPQEVGTILATCRKHETPLIATGSGSAVTGATLPLQRGVVLDLKRLNRIRWIDLPQGIAEVESGFIGIHLEEALSRAGATLGHFPSSILCSTLGGWIATRSAGQASSRYGKIEDMVIDIQVAFSDGTVRWLQGNFDLLPLLIGSEGMFGVIIAARLRIHPAPAARAFRGVLFPNVYSGTQAIRCILQEGGSPPAIIRLYDAVDTFISSHKNAAAHTPPLTPSLTHATSRQGGVSNLPIPYVSSFRKRARSALKIVRDQVLQRLLQSTQLTTPWIERVLPSQTLLILGCEGKNQREADARMQEALHFCSLQDGRDLGANPGWHWFHHRYSVSFKQPQVFLTGAFSDTLEVAAPWPLLMPLYREVKAALQEEAFVMAHFSHAYPDGCSIYFSFASYAPPHEELLKYDRLWRAGLNAASRIGATISHHHGIGLNKAPAIPLELGDHGHQLLQAVHRAFDPKAHLNPGKLSL